MKRRMMRAAAFLLLLSLCACSIVERPFWGAKERNATIERDIYGAPHISARTPADAAYALGYMHALDKPSELFKGMRSACGEGRRYFGESRAIMDWIGTAFDLRAVAEKAWPGMPKEVRRIVTSYTEGINARRAELGANAPEWMFEVEPVDIIAYNHIRMLHSIMIQANFTLPWTQMSECEAKSANHSNSWVAGPEKSRDGCVYGIIDPHLWWDEDWNFYEAHMEGPGFHWFGVMWPGCPMPILGHNEHIYWTMTGSAHPAADLMALKIDSAHPEQYFLDGEWRDFEVVRKTIGRLVDGKLVEGEFVIRRTPRGPVHYRDEQNNVAYVYHIAIADRPRQMEQFYKMLCAKNLDQFKEAISVFGHVSNNLVFGDADGNFGWFLYGYIPKRSLEGHENGQAVETWREKMEWTGFKTVDELFSVINPGCGYIQQCNCEPHLTVWQEQWDKYADLPTWPFDAEGKQVITETHERASMTHYLLHKAHGMTDADAMAIAVSRRFMHGPGTIPWLMKIIAAQRDSFPEKKELIDKCEKILKEWDYMITSESAGATLNMMWQKFLPERIKDKSGPEAEKAVLEALIDGAEFLQEEFGSLEVPCGRLCVLVWGDREYPCAASLAALRMIGFVWDDAKKRYIAGGGQTCTTVVRLKRGEPTRSWALRPYSITEDAKSPYYYKWVELFCRDEFRPTFFNRDDLEGNISEKIELKMP